MSTLVDVGPCMENKLKHKLKNKPKKDVSSSDEGLEHDELEDNNEEEERKWKSLQARIMGAGDKFAKDKMRGDEKMGEDKDMGWDEDMIGDEDMRGDEGMEVDIVLPEQKGKKKRQVRNLLHNWNKTNSDASAPGDDIRRKLKFSTWHSVEGPPSDAGSVPPIVTVTPSQHRSPDFDSLHQSIPPVSSSDDVFANNLHLPNTVNPQNLHLPLQQLPLSHVVDISDNESNTEPRLKIDKGKGKAAPRYSLTQLPAFQPKFSTPLYDRNLTNNEKITLLTTSKR
jgi:hypothetical protein